MPETVEFQVVPEWFLSERFPEPESRQAGASLNQEEQGLFRHASAQVFQEPHDRSWRLQYHICFFKLWLK